MSEIALRHGMTLFLGNFAGTATVANKESVYKWNVGVRFEGNKERDLKAKRNKWREAFINIYLWHVIPSSFAVFNLCLSAS